MSSEKPIDDEKHSQPSSINKDTNLQDAKVLVVNNADLARALEAGPPLKATSPASIQLFLILLVAFTGSMTNGFDGQVMGAVNGMKQYLDYFGITGEDAGGGVGTATALIFGIYSIGAIVGTVIAGPITDKGGRRGGMFLGSFIICIGAIVVTAARNQSYLLAGRFVLGFGVSITTTAAPAYVVEMSPPQWRGRLTGLYNTFYFSGSILCTGISIGTNRLPGEISWRAPLAIQLVPAGILGLLVWFLPESPRWLMATGKPDQARAILAKYHGNGDTNAPLVELEMKEFEESIKLDASDKRWWDYSELVNSHSARYRTGMMLMMGFFGQWSGNGLGYFLTILFNNAGVKSQDRRIVLNFANTLLSCGGALIGTSLADTAGRRTMWFWGTLSLPGILAIATGCTAAFGSEGSGNVVGANAAIAFIFIFNFVYSIAYTPLQALYPSECLEYNTRAKGMAIYSFAVSCASFLNTYSGPIALGTIGWRYYIVYIVWDLFEATIIWFFAVETKGRTLEELAEIFESAKPVKTSLEKHRIAVVQKAGRVEVVDVGEA